MNELSLDRREEALRGSVIVRGADRTHRGEDPGVAELPNQRERGGLRPLIRVMHEPLGRSTPADRHLERVDHELGPKMGGHGATDDRPGVQIHHRGEMQPPFVRDDVGDVRDPGRKRKQDPSSAARQA